MKADEIMVQASHTTLEKSPAANAPSVAERKTSTETTTNRYSTFTLCLELSVERAKLEDRLEEQRRRERLKELETLRERAKAD